MSDDLDNTDNSVSTFSPGYKIDSGGESVKRIRHTLRKGEKLRHRSLVESLFREGKSIYEFPIRLTWRMIDRNRLDSTFKDHVPDRIDGVQMLITIPKKKRRHAVDRVLMRRRLREAYRLNRKEILGGIMDRDGTLSLAFVYMHDKNLPYSTVERKMRSLLGKLADAVNKSLRP